MVEVVSGRTRFAREARAGRALPLPRGADAELLRQCGRRLYHCFGCGKGGEVITFVRETENVDFAGPLSGWRSASA